VRCLQRFAIGGEVDHAAKPFAGRDRGNVESNGRRESATSERSTSIARPLPVPGIVCQVAKHNALPPEMNLMLAVLEDGLLIFRSTAGASTRHGQRRFAEVVAWFASDDAEHPFSFL